MFQEELQKVHIRKFPKLEDGNYKLKDGRTLEKVDQVYVLISRKGVRRAFHTLFIYTSKSKDAIELRKLVAEVKKEYGV